MQFTDAVFEAIPCGLRSFSVSGRIASFQGIYMQNVLEKSSREFLWGSYDTVFSQKPILLSPSECWSLVQTANCRGNPMTKQGTGNAWSFEKDPEPESRWLSTTVTETINCRYEPVHLEQRQEGDQVFGLNGVMAEKRSQGYAVINFLTTVLNVGEEHNSVLGCTQSSMERLFFPEKLDRRGWQTTVCNWTSFWVPRSACVVLKEYILLCRMSTCLLLFEYFHLKATGVIAPSGWKRQPRIHRWS